jgi:hypothetical protein
VWIDPELHLVELLQPGHPPEFFQEGQELVITGLPDFRLPLTTLFTA